MVVKCINNSLHLARKILEYFLFRDANRGRVSFPRAQLKEQIISKDKYPSIFLRQMEAFVFSILEIFFATVAVLKIWEYCPEFPQFQLGSRDAFRPIARKRKYLIAEYLSLHIRLGHWLPLPLSVHFQHEAICSKYSYLSPPNLYPSIYLGEKRYCGNAAQGS